MQQLSHTSPDFIIWLGLPLTFLVPLQFFCIILLFDRALFTAVNIDQTQNTL